jgi:hypothetical protein
MRREGIVGVIHEASYPPFTRDSKYLDRHNGGAASSCSGARIIYGNAEAIRFDRLIIFSVLFLMRGHKLTP